MLALNWDDCKKDVKFPLRMVEGREEKDAER